MMSQMIAQLNHMKQVTSGMMSRFKNEQLLRIQGNTNDSNGILCMKLSDPPGHFTNDDFDAPEQLRVCEVT